MTTKNKNLSSKSVTLVNLRSVSATNKPSVSSKEDKSQGTDDDKTETKTPVASGFGSWVLHKTPTDSNIVSTDDDTNPSLVGFFPLNSYTKVVKDTTQSSQMKTLLNSFSGKSIKQLEHVHAYLRLGFSQTSSGSGGFSGAITFDPSGTSNWTQFASLFDEFRVISCEVHLRPNSRYNTANQGLFSITADNDSATVPANIDENIQYNISKQYVASENQLYAYKRPNITSSAYWVDCAAPSGSPGAIFVNSSANGTLPNSTLMYWGIVTYYVEFRGTR